MRKIFTIIALFCGSTTVFSQQDPQFSQYMYNKLFMNPAYVGMRQAVCATMIGRDQWAGFDGAPKSGVLSVDMVLPEDYHSGIGVNLMYDKLGFESNMRYSFNYSYHLKFYSKNTREVKSTLGIGVEIGTYCKRLGPTGGDQWVSSSNWMNDQSIPGSMKKTNLDMGFGLWYQAQNMWFGVSSTHLNAKLMDGGIEQATGHDLKYQIARHYFLTGGMTVFPRQTWELHPSFLVKSDATITTFDLNCIALFQEKFWVGASYRFQDAIVPMIGFQRLMTTKDRPRFFEGGFKIGFAYDYTTSKLNSYSNGSFELFMNYCLPIDWKTTRWGDVRFFD